MVVFFFKQKTAYEMRISDWSSDVCSSDLLGVSSMQIDQPERGFSFRADGPLDMRMEGPVAEGRPTAAEVVNSLPEAELADIIYSYGEERRARQVARAIVAARAEKPLARTGELAELVRRVVKQPKGQDRKSTRLNSSH